VVGRAWICQLYDLECCLGSHTLKWPVGVVFIATNQIVAVGEGCWRWAHRTVSGAPRRHLVVRAWSWSTVGGFVHTPDSPVNYSGAAPGKPEAAELKSIHPGAPDTVRWHTGQSGAPDQGTVRFPFCSFLLKLNLFFLLVFVEPLAPVECII
jgi:hypothetical protein